MLKNVIHCNLRVTLIVVIICSIQGHRPKRSSPSTIQHMASSAKGRTNNHDDISHTFAVRDSLVTNYTSHLKNPVVHDSKDFDLDDKIIFPSDSSEYITVEPKLKDISAASCENATFCENPPFYPEDFIKRAIMHRDDLKNLAFIDPAPDIDQRINTGEQDLLCSTENRVVFPRSGENKAKEWLFIVNDENFVQGVKIEACRNENAVCGVISRLLLAYETACKQNYVYRKMAAVRSDGSVDSDYFSFPASCCCHVKLRSKIESKLGIDFDKMEHTSAPRITPPG